MGSSATIDATDIGNQTYFVLYPNTKTTGDPLYKGYVRVGNISDTASTSTKITQTVQLVGDGSLTKGSAA